MKEEYKCPKCSSFYLHAEDNGELRCEKCGTRWTFYQKGEKLDVNKTEYPQDSEENEYRYLSPAWLDEIARGLTKGAVKHPGETWRKIPAREHAWRAIRHLVLYLKGDTQDKHLINASMRAMMAFETDKAANDVIEWEKLMKEKGCG